MLQKNTSIRRCRNSILSYKYQILCLQYEEQMQRSHLVFDKFPVEFLLCSSQSAKTFDSLGCRQMLRWIFFRFPWSNDTALLTQTRAYYKQRPTLEYANLQRVPSCCYSYSLHVVASINFYRKSRTPKFRFSKCDDGIVIVGCEWFFGPSKRVVVCRPLKDDRPNRIR